MINKNDNFQIRQMTKEDLKIVLSWANLEGWNPGIDDVDNFYVADPSGFFIGELNSQPICSISVVQYSSSFNFIGLYIVKPEERGKGYGVKIGNEALKLITNKPAALDGVLEKVNIYQKFGFKPSHSHLRYKGKIAGRIATNLIDIKNVDFEQLCRYDEKYFPSSRTNFLSTWIHQPHGKGYAIIQDNELVGYGMIRKAVDGFKIAPLFAENDEIAEKIFLALAIYADSNQIYIDVPDINKTAVAMFEKFEMTSTFECVRMYKEKPPNIDYQKIFGITSLELG